MRLLKETPLEVGWLCWQWRPPQPALTTVVKATFDLVPQGPCPLRDEQQPVCGELHHDDDPEQSLQCDSDLAPFKPHGECFVLGSFHAPGGQPVVRSQVAFKIGAVAKQIAVIGDRTWGMTRPSDPRPLVSVPLRWERAFGGRGVAANPLGRGVDKQQVGDKNLVLLPNLEDPQELIQAKSERPRPVCSAPLSRTFPSRMALAGTYDARWKRERYPHYAEDLRWEFFNAAPLDQQIQGYWEGTEEITLINLVEHQPQVRCHLPGLWPRCLLVPVDGGAAASVELELRLDTITVDGDARTVCCVWRAPREVPSESLAEYSHLLVAHDEPGSRQTLEQLRALAARKLSDEAGAVQEHEPEAPRPDPRPAASPASGDAPEPSASTEHPEQQPLFKTLMGAELKWAHVDQALTMESGAAPPQMLREMAALLKERGISPDAIGGNLAKSLKSLIDPEPAQRPIDEHELREIEARVMREEDERRRSGVGLALRRRVQEATLHGQSCRGWDLTDVDLSALRFSGGDFRGAIFKRASLAGAIFGDTLFDGAIFEEAELSDANFHGASLAGVHIHFSRLERTHFGDCTLDDAAITESFLRDARFSRTHARRIELTGSHLERTTFDDSVFEGADFSQARLDDALFARTSLADAWLIDGIEARRMRLDRCDISLLRAFGGTNLEECRFAACIGNGARFHGATLGGSDFSFSELERADFSEAMLANAKLMGCRLRAARFDGARLLGASLIRSDLYQARFEEADLTGADLRGANLFQAELWRARLTDAQLELAELTGTRLAR